MLRSSGQDQRRSPTPFGSRVWSPSAVHFDDARPMAVQAEKHASISPRLSLTHPAHPTNGTWPLNCEFSASLRRKAWGADFSEKRASVLAGGGLFSTSLQRRQALLDLVGGEGLWIEVVAQPLDEFFVLFMFGIAGGFQQIVEAG